MPPPRDDDVGLERYVGQVATDLTLNGKCGGAAKATRPFNTAPSPFQGGS